MLEYSLIVKLLTEHHLASLSLKSICTGLSESTHVKIPHCWKSHVAAHMDPNTECAHLEHKPTHLLNNSILLSHIHLALTGKSLQSYI